MPDLDDDNYKPRHAAPACGVRWCTDPNCGEADPKPEVGEPTYLPYWLDLAIVEFRDARRARLDSTPRRVATRFGLATVTFLGLGMSAPSMADAAESLTATVMNVIG